MTLLTFTCWTLLESTAPISFSLVPPETFLFLATITPIVSLTSSHSTVPSFFLFCGTLFICFWQLLSSQFIILIFMSSLSNSICSHLYITMRGSLLPFHSPLLFITILASHIAISTPSSTYLVRGDLWLLTTFIWYQVSSFSPS